MKLIGYTLLDIDDYLQKENNQQGNYAVSPRAHCFASYDRAAHPPRNDVPKEYQEIRLQLGNAAARSLRVSAACSRCIPHIWHSFKSYYLEKQNLTIEQIYNSNYSHSDAYVVAEALVEYDELFHAFASCTFN